MGILEKIVEEKEKRIQLILLPNILNKLGRKDLGLGD